MRVYPKAVTPNVLIGGLPAAMQAGGHAQAGIRE
jgi:hypothetical protein